MCNEKWNEPHHFIPTPHGLIFTLPHDTSIKKCELPLNSAVNTLYELSMVQCLVSFKYFIIFSYIAIQLGIVNMQSKLANWPPSL